MIRRLLAATTAALLAGCATESGYFSTTPGPATPGSLHVQAAGLLNTTVVVYEDPVACSRKHPVAMYKRDLDTTVYLPPMRYVTILVSVMQSSAAPGFKYANLMYTVPYGDLRIHVSGDALQAHALIEKRAPEGWVPVKDVIPRTFKQPIVGDDWCVPDPMFAH